VQCAQSPMHLLNLPHRLAADGCTLQWTLGTEINKLYAWWHGDTICSAPLLPLVGAPAPRVPPSRRNVVSHAQYVLTVTAAPASRVQAAVSKAPGDLDLLTLKVVSESHVTWATSVPILVFLCLSVLDLGPMYATDRQTSDTRRQTTSSLNAPAYLGRGITSCRWRLP